MNKGTGELERFTHEIFVQGGAHPAHAWPTSPRKHRIPLPHETVRGAIETLKDAVVALLQETIRDCLIAFGAVGTFLSHFGPAASLPVLVIVVVCVQAGIRRVK